MVCLDRLMQKLVVEEGEGDNMSSEARALLRGWKQQLEEESSRRTSEALKKAILATKMTIVRGDIVEADLAHTIKKNLLARIETQRKRGDLSYEDASFWDLTHSKEDDTLNLLFTRLQHKKSELQKLQEEFDALA